MTEYVCSKSALSGQGFKDPMHCNEHGNSMLTTKCTVIKLRKHAEKEFPFGVRRADGTLRLYWCTEKQHSMVHWASTYETVGRCRTISANVTESRMKTAVKTKARKINNQASFGSSILKANTEVEAAA